MARLGIMLEGQEGITWERWNRHIDLAESAGFDSLWRSDHLFSLTGPSDRATLALWPSLAVAAARSSRIELGQLVSPTTFRHPVHLAQDATALDHLAGGRFLLGVGAGWNEPEHQAFGFELPPLKARMDRFEEALEVITRLWTGEKVSFDGEYYQLRDAQMRPTPTRPGRVPLVIGGSGERRVLRLVAQYADEWNVVSVDKETYKRKVEVLERHCAAVGRDPATIRRSWMKGHLIGRDSAELRTQVQALQRVNLSLADLSPDEVISRQRERGWLVGSPDEIIEEIKAREALGVERFMLQTLNTENTDALELFAAAVLPHV